MKLRRTTRSGVAALEFAVVIPFLLVVILGVWEVGRYLEVQQGLDNSTREGGRQASTAKRTNAEVASAVYQYLLGVNSIVDNPTSLVSADTYTGKSLKRVYSGTTTGGTAYAFTIWVENLTADRDALDALQLDVIRIKVSYPAQAVRWLSAGRFLPNGSTLDAQSEWCSMADVPLVVPTTIPTKPAT